MLQRWTHGRKERDQYPLEQTIWGPRSQCVAKLVMLYGDGRRRDDDDEPAGCSYGAAVQRVAVVMGG